METGKPFQKVRMKNRPGFETHAMRWLYRLVYPFFHCRVRIPEELRESEEPVVFIANHYNIFGPPSFVVSVPLVSNLWLNEELVNEESALATIIPSLKKMLPFLSDRMVEKLSRKIAWISVHLLTKFGAIPVNRNDPKKLIHTMRESLSALEAGKNLLIFPEIGLPEYSLTSVTPFFSGFAMLGRLYYRKTGKRLRFCPCYIDEQHHQIRIGEIVEYNPDTGSDKEETERVSDELNLRIREMAAENWGVEKEQISAGRRTVLFFCNLIRFLLLIPLVTMVNIPNPLMILVFYLISHGIRIVGDAVRSTYSASNRTSFLLSQMINGLTDLTVLAYFVPTVPRLRLLLWVLVLGMVVFLVSNAIAYMRYRRCAGVNYFDTLSTNAMLSINLLLLLEIRLTRVIFGALKLVTAVFLVVAACFDIAFNARIGREERMEESSAA